MRTARIAAGGRSSPTGGVYNRGERKMSFNSRSNSAASTNPTSGETSSASPTFSHAAQFTPRKPLSFHRLFAIPTPRMEPMSVCELLTGRPMYQVPRFHATPASRSDSTMTSAAPERALMSRWTGNR